MGSRKPYAVDMWLFQVRCPLMLVVVCFSVSPVLGACASKSEDASPSNTDETTDGVLASVENGKVSLNWELDLGTSLEQCRDNVIAQTRSDPDFPRCHDRVEEGAPLFDAAYEGPNLSEFLDLSYRSMSITELEAEEERLTMEVEALKASVGDEEATLSPVYETRIEVRTEIAYRNTKTIYPERATVRTNLCLRSTQSVLQARCDCAYPDEARQWYEAANFPPEGIAIIEAQCGPKVLQCVQEQIDAAPISRQCFEGISHHNSPVATAIEVRLSELRSRNNYYISYTCPDTACETLRQERRDFWRDLEARFRAAEQKAREVYQRCTKAALPANADQEIMNTCVSESAASGG